MNLIEQLMNDLEIALKVIGADHALIATEDDDGSWRLTLTREGVSLVYDHETDAIELMAEIEVSSLRPRNGDPGDPPTIDNVTLRRWERGVVQSISGTRKLPFMPSQIALETALDIAGHKIDQALVADGEARYAQEQKEDR